MRRIMGLIALLAATPCFGQSQFLASIGGWRIERDASRCWMMSRYINGNTILIANNAGSTTLEVAITNSQWQSIQIGADYPVTVHVNKAVYPENAKGFINATGKGLHVSIPLDELDHLGRGSFAVRRGDATIAGFQFDRSEDDAFLVLSRCVQGQGDPFTK